MSIYSDLKRVAADIKEVREQVRAISNAPQSQRTSVEGGSIDFNDADGNLKAIVGEQEDGGNTVNVVAGPTPPTPANFTVTVDHGSLTVHWDGDFEGGAVAPSDWARWTAYAQSGQFVVPDRTTSIGGTDSASGGEVTAGVLKGQWTVTLLAWSQAGKPSAMATPVTVDVPGYGDIVLAEIDAAETVIKNAGEVLVSEQGTLDEKLTEVDGTLNDLGQDLQAVEDAQAQLGTDLTDVMTSVDGKNTITWNPSAPSAVSTPGAAVGDLWYRTSGNNIIGFWKWDGTDWVTQLLDVTTIPLIDIGAGTFGSFSGSRLDVGSVTADKMLIGGSENIIPMSGVDAGAGVNPHSTYGGRTIELLSNPVAGREYTNAIWMKGQTDGTLGTWDDAISFNSGGLSGQIHAGQAFPVKVGQTFRFDSFLIRRGSEPDGRVFARMSIVWYDFSGNAISRVSGAENGGVYTTDNQIFVEGTAPNSAAYLRLYVQTDRRGDIVVWRTRLLEQKGTVFIEAGGITTPKLAADVLEVKNLKATTGQLDEAVINKLFSDVVVAKTAVANAFIGENAILTGAVTAPKITASEELWAKIAQFVKIRAEHIEADAIDGMVITGPTIRSAASGQRWQGDANGIRIFNADDEVRTQLSPEGSTFKGEVEADTLVVNGGAELRGTTNTLAQGAKLTLAAGVTDPTAPPVVQPYWEGIEFTPPDLMNGSLVGLAFDGTNYWTTAGSWYEATAPTNQVFRVNGSTGAVTGFPFPVSGTSERFGVTCIGSELFWLYRSGYDHKVVVTDLNCVKKRDFAFADAGHSPSNPLTYKPGIGNDGTNVVIAHASDDGTLRVRTYNKTTGAQIGSTVAEGNTNFKSDITGVHVGVADGSVSRIWVKQDRTGVVYSYTTAGVYVSGEQFNTAAANCTGVVFAGGKFHTLDPSGVIHEYADSNTGDNAGDWWAGYGWWKDVDDDLVAETSDYQSRMSPPARFAWPRRAGIKIIGQSMPSGADYLIPWLAKKPAGPVRTDFHGTAWDFETGKPVARIRALPTNWSSRISPPDVNTFPEGDSSVLESASGTFKVQGDGSGHWGPLKMARNGIMSGLIVSGQVNAYVDTGGTAKSFTINLPAGRFTKPPRVWAIAGTGYPQLISVGVPPSDITTTTFQLAFYRANTTPTPVVWFAMDSE